MTLRALTVGCCFGIAAALIALPLRADDAPAIIDIAIAPQPVHGGQQATTTVATTSDVTSVEARVAFVRIPIPQVAPGRFTLVRDIPAIPRLFRRKYNVTFVARSPDGEARTDLTVDVR